MGEYAEMELERGWDDEFGIGVRLPDFRVWKCRDGRVIRVRDMEDSHLQNTISMLERKNCRAFDGWVDEMRKELSARKSSNVV